MTNNERLDLNLAIVFLALWRERSVGGAARRLSLTQPAVSQSLARLRGLCGDRLFVRTRAGMRPTARAEAMAAGVESGVQLLRGLLTPSSGFDPVQSQRRFTIGFQAGLDYTLGARLAERMHEIAPHVLLVLRRLEPRHAHDALARREVDIALVAGDLRHPDYECSQMATFRFAGLWSPQVTAPVVPVDLLELLRWRHVLVETSMRSSPVTDQLRLMGHERVVHAVVPGFGHLPMFLRAPGTIAVVPDFIADSLEGHDGLRTAPLPAALGGGEIVLLCQRGVVPDEGRLWLRDEILRLGLTPAVARLPELSSAALLEL